LVLAGLIGVPAASFLYQTVHAASGERPPPVKMTKEEDRRGRNGTGDQNDPNFAN